jgi:malate/lactate dehydrogenase
MASAIMQDRAASEILIVDRDAGRCRGAALDLSDAAALFGSEVRCHGPIQYDRSRSGQ